MAMPIKRYGAERIAQCGRSRATLDAIGLSSGNYSPLILIAPADAMVIDFGVKSSCGVVKLLFEASVKKSRNGPSTQLIEATSCVERSNATIKAKELT
jgi:hypothetical protein